MAESLFQRKTAAPATQPVTPHELIEHEVSHLKKGKTARHGDKPRQRASIWLLIFLLCALIGLYIMDPVMHAFYRYEAVHVYVYLHNSGTGKEADELAASGILRPEEIAQLNRSLETYKDEYASPKDAAWYARIIVNYMASVKTLHSGVYDNLDDLGRVRYTLFIRTGLIPPTSWDWLDPSIGS